MAERRAYAAVRHQIVDVYAATLHRVMDSAEEQPHEWTQAATSSDTFAYLTAAELAQASAELQAVSEKWRAHGNPARSGAEAVQIIVHAFRRP